MYQNQQNQQRRSQLTNQQAQNIQRQSDQRNQIANPNIAGSRPFDYHTSQYRGYEGAGTPRQYNPNVYHTANYRGYSEGNAPQGNVQRSFESQNTGYSSLQGAYRPQASVSDQASRAVARGANVQYGTSSQVYGSQIGTGVQSYGAAQQVQQQLNDFRQNLDQINQLAGELDRVEQENQRQIDQLYQIELENYRRLEQLSQQEAQASQRLQQIQQLCQQANQQFNSIVSQVEISLQ